MEIYLAGTAPWKEKGIYDEVIRTNRVSVLESYYYADEITERMIPMYGRFILDSGAFTFFAGNHDGLDWEQYVDRYAAFIVKNKVTQFLELDIDSVAGYDKVIELRRRLEQKTGLQPIPVWHRSRGKEEYLRMLDEYPYCAIGCSGKHDSAWTRKQPGLLRWFIAEAHKRKRMLHGLGFTKLDELPKLHFDSVDSTAWLSGNRFGCAYYFDGKTIRKRKRGEAEKIKYPAKLAAHNFSEWVNFQRYARFHY